MAKKRKKTRSRGSSSTKRKGRSSGSKSKDKRKFKYKKTSKESLKKRADQQGGMYDSPWVDKYSVFKPKQGDFALRICPVDEDTMEEYELEHYGIDVWVHYGVGADGHQFACPNKMKGDACPVCEEVTRAQREGEDEQYVRDLKPARRVLVWMIDRDNEDEGPQLWPMPWTMDRDITSRCFDKRSGEVLDIVDPEEGYDVEFQKEGQGQRTKYIGIDVARKPTPLADDEETMDEWLQFITENPLPECVKYYDYEHMETVLEGGKGSDDEDEDEEEDDEPKTRSKSKAKGKGKRSRRDEEEDDEDEEEDDEEDDDEDEDLDDDEEEDEEEDDDDDEDDEDEEEEDDDEEDDDEEEDEEEEEEEPKSKRKKKGKKGAVRDRVRGKMRKKSSSKKSGKKKRRRK